VNTLNKKRADQAAALEKWADEVIAEDLVEVDTRSLQRLREVANQRAAIDAAVTDAVKQARLANRSWAEIGLMLGVTKQAAQRKYGHSKQAA
jgi:hypothetical protein